MGEIRRIAFLYPGQGAQKAGMAQDFYEKSEAARSIFERADQVLDFSVCDMIFHGDDRLDQTEYTQAALLTACMAITAELTARGIRPDFAAGLSLGEFGALTAAGVLSFEEAVRLVRKRGIYMEQAVPAGEGAMSAVLGLDAGSVERVLAELPGVEIANDNCPGQLVIAGEAARVAEAGERLKEAGAKRVVSLNVSGPFHSAMLAPAGVRLAAELANTEIRKPRIPYASNVTGSLVTEAEPIRRLLADQVSSRVRWQDNVKALREAGATHFIEIGPGRTLTGFLRKIDRSLHCCNIEKWEDLEQLESFL